MQNVAVDYQSAKSCPQMTRDVSLWHLADIGGLANVRFAPVAAIVADKTARSSGDALPTSVRNPEMSLPASALVGECFPHTRTLHQAARGSPREAGSRPT
jgi:hypothetical protein